MRRHLDRRAALPPFVAVVARGVGPGAQRPAGARASPGRPRDEQRHPRRVVVCRTARVPRRSPDLAARRTTRSAVLVVRPAGAARPPRIGSAHAQHGGRRLDVDQLRAFPAAPRACGPEPLPRSRATTPGHGGAPARRIGRGAADARAPRRPGRPRRARGARAGRRVVRAAGPGPGARPRRGAVGGPRLSPRGMVAVRPHRGAAIRGRRAPVSFDGGFGLAPRTWRALPAECAAVHRRRVRGEGPVLRRGDGGGSGSIGRAAVRRRRRRASVARAEGSGPRRGVSRRSLTAGPAGGLLGDRGTRRGAPRRVGLHLARRGRPPVSAIPPSATAREGPGRGGPPRVGDRSASSPRAWRRLHLDRRTVIRFRRAGCGPCGPDRSRGPLPRRRRCSAVRAGALLTTTPVASRPRSAWQSPSGKPITSAPHRSRGTATPPSRRALPPGLGRRCARALLQRIPGVTPDRQHRPGRLLVPVDERRAQRLRTGRCTISWERAGGFT